MSSGESVDSPTRRTTDKDQKQTDSEIQTDGSSFTADDDIEITYNAWEAATSLRYYNESQDTLAQLQPENDWWVALVIKLRNLGSQPVQPPNVSNFKCLADGRTFSTKGSYPQISEEQTRISNDYPYLQNIGYDGSRGIESGDQRIDVLLTDVPASESILLKHEGDPSVYLDPKTVTITPKE